jgi:hypothetical protein
MARRDLDTWIDERTIDLHPANWISDRPKPAEPFWGDGWPEALAYLIGLSITMATIHHFR